MLATPGCAVLTGASDLSVSADGGAEGSREGSTTEGGRPSVETEAGSVSPDDDAGVDADAAPDARPDASADTVRCNDAECSGRCCIREGIGICVVAQTSCPTLNLELSCDEPADCPLGSVCCLTFESSSAYARCTPSCSTATMCKVDGDCPPSLACKAYPDLGIGPAHGFGICQ